jgi:hypothetical protein
MEPTPPITPTVRRGYDKKREPQQLERRSQIRASRRGPRRHALVLAYFAGVGTCLHGVAAILDALLK